MIYYMVISSRLIIEVTLIFFSKLVSVSRVSEHNFESMSQLDQQSFEIIKPGHMCLTYYETSFTQEAVEFGIFKIGLN